jgi:hypothetical protein
MCCSFSIIQGACVEISMDTSNFTPQLIKIITYNTELIWVNSSYFKYFSVWLIQFS